MRRISGTLFLQISAVCVFAGRAWQHLFWDAPFRELLWDEDWMKWPVEFFTSLTWDEYMTTISIDVGIQKLVFWEGIFYTLCAVTAVFIRKLPKAFRVILWLGTANLFILALLYMKEFFFHLGQFFEFALQFSSPVFLYYALRQGGISDRLTFWIKIAIALTFTCHGLYAIGYYPLPGTFMEMTVRILGVNQHGARIFLRVAATLDFIVALGIFLPAKWSKWFLLYAAFWGLATSLARIFGNFFWEFPWESLHQWVFQSVYRLPHAFVPFALFVKTIREKNLEPAY